MPWTDKPSNGSNNNGPWGRPQNNGGGGGQGGGGGPRGGRGQGTPDLEELLRSGRERFGRGRGGNGGGGTGQQMQVPSGPVLVLVLIAVFVFWLLSGVYQVQPGSRGVVTTFGNFSKLTDSGLNWHVPWPVQDVDIVDVENDRRITIGRGRTSMLTSDLNIVDVTLDVNFQIASDATWNPDDPELPNAAKFIFNIEDPALTVQAAAEAALREVVGANEFGPIVSRGRAVVNERTTEILQQTLDSYDSGIEVIRTNFGDATPPEQVIPAQRDVIDATSQAEQKVNVAQGIANRIVPVAEGDARQIVLDAEAYAARVVADARGDAARFTSILTEYEKAPEVTRQRMYLETLEDVLGGMNKVLIDEDAGGTLPYLNINELARDSQRVRNNAPRSNGGDE
ncbi:FtsH protease activity modulator HflK [Parvularcula sp. ZS-1/3]|uniref:Protein HflK n=1 Tax=Parvularcula mediterranea TaxID=2732508 RepID=A0A7Y3RJY7_9PROT|nr:FtsH protease activity modulator HflK [Parvularcula mediterranea]NNU15406.1 FtsH protease activity modulator HflK [Parvularcula mediterranea]